MSDEAMAWARAMRVSSSGAKLVLYVIANRAGKDGVVPDDLSQADIAAEAQLSERQVRRIIKELEPVLERTARPGVGSGRKSDALRLKMSETPVIIGVRRRQPDILSGEATGHLRQPDISNRTSRPVGATGQKEIPPTPPKEKTTPLPKGSLTGAQRVSPADAVIAAARPHFSKTGAKRLKPADSRKALEPLIARHGLEAVSAAARRFYADPYQHRDGGDFQPGLQVIANDGRLEALIQATPSASDGPDWAKRYALHDADGTWLARWGPPPGDPFHEGPRKEAAA